MKTIILSISLMFTATFLSAQNTSNLTSNGTTITVSVPCKSSEGNVLVGLYSEDTFLKAAPLKSVSAEIVDGKAIATFENVKAGTYGISLFQDKNSNKQMDFDANGMPLEPYGVSNNIMSYGPPLWSDAKFEVSEQPISLEIRM
jgi:uncharacterized protein (DUF2141 family)